MSFALSKAAPLKAEIRLAQAVSQFEADLSSDQKADFRSQKSKTCKNPPSAQDVMYLTAKIDWETSRKAGGGGRCFGPRFTNVLQAVQQFAALGDVIIGGSQNIIACGVWSLVRMTLLSLVNYSSYMEKLSALLMVAGRSAPRYQKMALLYPRSRILQSHLSEYFIVVVQLCHHMLKTTKRSVIGQLVSSLSDQELSDYENALLRWATAIKEEADLLINERIDDQGVRVKMLLKLSESEAYRQKFRIHCQILDRCSVYDYETTWKEIRKAGSTALLSSIPEYASWKTHTGPSTLLLRGKLGAGKSVLLANAVDDLNLHISTSQTPVAYFFCRHDILESLKARTVIGSLARQLLRSCPLLTTLDVIDETLPNMDCGQILSALRKILPASFRAYFVLDGLDECDQKERVTILDHVRSLQQMFRLLACLSFRVDASSTQWWLPSMVINPNMVTIPDENPDIARFISSELESIIKSGRLKVGDPAIVLEIEDALLQGSQGMFLWVALQIESLCSAKTDDSIRKALANLPKDLPETFIRIIQNSGKAGKDYQMSVFELVLAASRPLAVEELQEALSVCPGNTTWNSTHSLNDIYSALACCGSLISINEEGLTVKLIHHSVKQFLLGQSLLSHAGLFTLDRANRTLGEIIITYLNYDVFSGAISRTVIPEIRPEASPSKIVKSMGMIAPVQTLALKYLQSRKQQLGYSIGKTLIDAARNGQPHGKTPFHFHSYAKSHWQDHIMFVPVSEQATMSLVVKLIMSYPALDYIGDSPNGEQHLLPWAVEQGHEEIVRALLDMGVNIEVRNPFGMTPLCLAVEKEHESLVRFLVKKGADLESKSNIGMTPLFLAVRNKNQSTARILISHGADPDVSSEHDEVHRLIQTIFANTIAHKPPWESTRIKFGMVGQSTQTTCASAHGLAFVNGDEAMVLLLLTFTVRVSDWLDKLGFDPIEYAVTSSHAQIVKTVLRRDNYLLYNRIVFSTAIRNHDIAAVRAALENIPSSTKRLYLSAVDERGDGLLQLAIRECQPDIVCLLLQNGADPNFDTTTRFTPLIDAVMLANKEILQALIDHGADVNLRDYKNRTVLSWAAEGGDPEVIDFLVSSKGFDQSQYNIRDTDFRAPLTYAILRKNFHAARRLLEHGASPNIFEGKDTDTTLMRAISEDFPAAVELLLAHGAHVGGFSGSLCLQRAIVLGSLESVKHLISYGARMGWCLDLDSMTAETSLESKFARDQGQPEIASYLEERDL